MWKRILRDVLIGVAGAVLLATIIYYSPYLRTWTKRELAGAILDRLSKLVADGR